MQAPHAVPPGPMRQDGRDWSSHSRRGGRGARPSALEVGGVQGVAAQPVPPAWSAGETGQRVLAWAHKVRSTGAKDCYAERAAPQA